jgi:hypothetical protein
MKLHKEAEHLHEKAKLQDLEKEMLKREKAIENRKS